MAFSILFRSIRGFRILPAAILVIFASHAHAETVRPTVIASIAGYDRLMGDIEMIGRICDRPGVERNLEKLLEMSTQGRGLEGLDRKKPWGLFVYDDAGSAAVVGIVPVKDLRPLLALADPLGVRVAKTPTGVYKLSSKGMTAYARSRYGYTMVSTSTRHLGFVRSSPHKLLAGLTKRYDFALRVDFAALSDSAKTTFLEKLKEGGSADLIPEEGTALLNYAAKSVDANRTGVGTQFRDSFETAANDQLAAIVEQGRDLTIGLELNEWTDDVSINLAFRALPDTKLSERFARLSGRKSRFSGFVNPKAVFSANTTAPIQLGKIHIEHLLAEFREKVQEDAAERQMDSATAEAYSQAFEEIFRVTADTLQEPEIDFGAFVNYVPNRLDIVGGISVTDGQRIRLAVQKIARIAAKSEPITMKESELENVRLLTVQVPVDKSDDASRIVFGNNVRLIVGATDREVYFGMGRDPVQVLKKCIARSSSLSETAVPLSRVIVSMTGMIEAAKRSIKGKQAESPFVPYRGDDQIAIITSAKGNSVQMRFWISPSLIKATGDLFQSYSLSRRISQSSAP